MSKRELIQEDPTANELAMAFQNLVYFAWQTRELQKIEIELGDGTVIDVVVSARDSKNIKPTTKKRKGKKK